MKKFLILFLFFFSVATVYPHPGRLDKNGGHWDRKTGTYHYHRQPTTPAKPATPPKPETHAEPKAETKGIQTSVQGYCTRVVDGDTIEVFIQGKPEKIRLIGVDTPETVDPRKPVEYFGKEASEFTKTMVEGKPVRLEFDQTKRDKYDRLLAYVYVDDTLLNAEIIRQGYGHAYTEFPFKYMEEFVGYEREARENKRGLWK